MKWFLRFLTLAAIAFSFARGVPLIGLLLLLPLMYLWRSKAAMPKGEHKARNIKRTYFVALGLSAVFALVMSVKDMAILVLFVTLGLGFPLLFSATAFAYLACFLPLVLSWKEPSKRPLAAALTALALAIVGILPGYLSIRDRDSYAARLAVVQITPTAIQPYRTIEIQNGQGAFPDFAGNYGRTEGCDTVCRTLLENGEADWIRIAATGKKDNNGKFDSNTLYVSGSGEACRVPGSSNPVPAHCVLIQPDNKVPPALLIRLESGYGDGLSTAKQTGKSPLKGWRRITAISGSIYQGEPILRAQEQSFEQIFVPTIIGPMLSGMSSSGFELMKNQTKIAPIDYVATIRMLGFKVEIAPEPVLDPKKKSWQAEPTDADIRGVLSALNLPGNTPFNQAQNDAVNQWVEHARIYKDWTSDRLDIASRVLADRRVGHVGFFDQVFIKPAVAKLLLPKVLEEVQSSDISKPHGALESALWAIDRIDMEILKENRAQIIAIVAGEMYGKFGRSFIYAASLVGENPLPYVAGYKGDNIGGVTIKAICIAQPVGAPAYIEKLRRLMDGENLDEQWPSETSKNALFALLVHGDIAFVQEIVGKTKWRTKDRFVADMIRNRDDKRNPISNKCRD